MLEDSTKTASWVAPWWFIATASAVMGVFAGVGSILIDQLITDPDTEPMPRWLSFMIGLIGVGGGTATQMWLRRRKRLRSNS